MTRVIGIASLLVCASCTTDIDEGVRVGAADVADAGTTAIGLASGFVEANPLMAAAGPAAPLAVLAAKPIGKQAAVALGSHPRDANRMMEAMSITAACANAATLAGVTSAVTGPAGLLIALPIGAMCGAAYMDAVPPHAKYYARRAGTRNPTGYGATLDEARADLMRKLSKEDHEN